MSDVKKLQQERTQCFHDVCDNKIPKRVPINISFSVNVVAEYAGIHGKEALWHPGVLEEAADRLCGMIPTDVCPLGMQILLPSKYQTLGANVMEVSSTGFMQHPNHVGFLPEDYDFFIEDPYACIIERVLPRNFRALDPINNPYRSMMSMYQSALGQAATQKESFDLIKKLNEKYGFHTGEPGGRTGCYAPLDILTDTLRSLSGMAMDIRRMPDKVAAAVEAIYPINYRAGIPQVINNYSVSFFPLHMATFMKEKDFVTLFWKPWFRQVTDYASLGLHTAAFCEHDWMRYLDYLYELPTDTQLQFEQGDPKLVKEKLGRKHILTGLFPLSIMRTASKRECIDKTKKFLDIMMPNGKFIFSFDKTPLTYEDVDLDKLIAICETVREHGVYDNAGSVAGEVFNKDDYIHSDIPPIKSKYYRTFEDYLQEFPNTPESAREDVQAMEDAILSFIYFICM
ncbi:MAG: uroporphyrinogen decarboxylase [Clostridiales bacterium]|nr:uroporphyrinogen decarboxylase [Clostridiales bacterium]